MPAPGAYNNNKNRIGSAVSAKIGTSKRTDLVSNSQNPGPGTFKVTQDWTKHKRGASFG